MKLLPWPKTEQRNAIRSANHLALVNIDQEVARLREHYQSRSFADGFYSLASECITEIYGPLNLMAKGSVLVPNDPGFREYGSNPYVGYDASERPFLFSGDLPDGIDPMARVVVFEWAEPRAELAHRRRDFLVPVLVWRPASPRASSAPFRRAVGGIFR
jgi:hypothetical protein